MNDTYSDIKFHKMLIGDEIRSKAYRNAINKVVNANDVVVDIGSGSGLLALFCVQAGASKVYAIERTDIIELAKKLAVDNDCSSKIEFIKEDAFSVELPEKVDVIVSELISKAVIGQRYEELVSHFRDKFLKPKGKIIPEHLNLMVAPISMKKVHRQMQLPSIKYNIAFAAMNQYLRHAITNGRFKKKHLISKAQVAYNLNSYKAIELDYPNCQLQFVINNTSELSGFATWFKAKLAFDIVLNTGPPGIKSWDNLFFFLPRPVKLDKSSVVDLKLLGRQTGGGVVWSWITIIKNAVNEDKCLEFRQNNFSATVLSKETFSR